ncbi:MAG TPA: CBS domain-containing protein [Nitrospirae bacterium]|nr:CCA-adding enzyme [bacterium BMS3Abin06]HDH11231.1 CBS domain-containing protein [Nitrospirota bacterium]HDZ02472.1 CBS domain-containing protein [Nitrospirota bacterium]
MDVITTHLNADFDALASMAAARKYYPDAIIVFPGSQEKNVRDFLEKSHITLEFRKLKDINLQEVTRLILVDVKSPSRIGKFSEILGKEGLIIHIFDHHPLAAKDIKGDKEIIENVGATTTIFTEMIRKDKIRLSPVEATLLMLGIYEETGSLIFPSTTVRDLTAAAFLLKKGANLKIVSGFITRELGPEEIDLLNELIQAARGYVIHDMRIKIARASRETYIGDIAFLAHKILEIEEVDAIFLVVMMKDRVQVIARSHTPEVDVSEVLHEIGGGGHPQAASAVVRDMSLEETESRLLSILEKKIHPSKTAKDIMTSPVKTIPWNTTIKTAEKTMTKYGVNVLPVLKKDIFYGLISREVVEKALFHGFDKSRVAEFCTTGVPTVKPSTALNIVESLMIEQNRRFMPVVEGNKITGAITRTDLLRSLYESLLRKNRISAREKLTEKPSIGKNLSSALKSRFPPEIFNLLKLSGEVAGDLGFSAYLVGGSVRDLLRGETNFDIDIVIEGNGITFAQALAEKLNVKVKSHKRFGTAVVITDFLKFDVATARTEYYESPAALPRVEISSIKKDLYRRDFTINTLAIKLDPGDFGKLIDFFGGQKDIKEKTIRILHNLSFIEDPTRAFRAIRFSERFGFKISKHTINLIKTAVRINLFDKLSGSRMYDELNLLFTETEPLKAVKRLAELDLLKFIHHGLAVTKTLEETFKAIQETYAWFKLLFFEEELNKSHLFLMALLNELTPRERSEALQRLFVPPAARKEILDAIEQSEKALTGLQKASQKEIYHTLFPLNLPTILFTMARAGDEEQKKAISLYLTELRKIRPELRGKDLKNMGYTPGPLFKKILVSLLEARLERKIKSREEEIEFVKNNFPVQ